MKKIIAGFIAVLLLSFCLYLNVSAAEADFAISEDLQTLVYHGETYRRTDVSAVSVIFYNELSQQPQLSAEQQELLRGTSFRIDSTHTVIEAELYFRDGSTLYCGFVSEDYAAQIEEALDSDQTQCYVEFYWENALASAAPEARYKGTPTTLRARDLQDAEVFPVYADLGRNSFTVIKGSLLIVGNRLYYVNHHEANFFYPYCIDTYDLTSLDCYEITDPELAEGIKSDLGRYYDAAYTSGGLLGAASVAFWVFIFGLMPAAILVLSVIFFRKGKGYYRTVWGVTGLCAVAELSLFALFIITVL